VRIVRFSAENIKRLVAVEIEPDGSVVVISGSNGAGKSSCLDAIWLALGGGPAARETPRPIRDGQEHARADTASDRCAAPECDEPVVYLGLCLAHAEEETGPANPSVEDLVGPL